MFFRPVLFRRISTLGLLGVFFVQAALPLHAAAQEARLTDPLIDAADRQIRNAQYDDAIQALEEAIVDCPDPGRLRMYYLLLIKGRVMKAGELRFQNQASTADDVLSTARTQVNECLTTPGLQHTRPGPEVDPPAEMVDLFDQVRSRIFGSLKIDMLDPPHSIVIFQGDTLRAAETGGSLIEQDIAVGSYVVVIQAEGYKTRTENITITPGSEVLRDYALRKNRGTGWWLLRGGVLAAVATAVGLGIGTDTTVLSPLPGPPDPPGAPRR